MRIDRIELFHVAMPLLEPWRTAYGDDAAAESVLVCMRSGELSAWAESCPLAAPCYSGEWAGGVFACVRDWMAPALIGQAINSGEELQARLAHFKGNPFAKAVLDNAWWVLEAVRQARPLHELLGARRSSAEAGADFGVDDDLSRLVERIGAAYANGYRRVKLKFRPGWGLEMLAAVRREFPTQTLHVDCNAAYSIDDAPLLCRLDDFQLAMIEQPLSADDLIDHARLQSLIRTPICLDESISSLARAETALDLGSCRYVNLKPGRLGGLTVALAVIDRCRQAAVPCWVGGMLESAIGARICAALAMLEQCSYPADIFPSARFYARDLADPPLELHAGPDGAPHVTALDLPGIGTAPNPQRLVECTRAQATIEAN